MSHTIHQEIIINASSHRVYTVLTNSAQFSEMTGMPAQINLVDGGQFSCFSGMITGCTIEAVPDERLVQAWRAGNWDAGIYSIAKFEFKNMGDEKTKVVFDHAGFPEEHRDHLAQGWNERYWQPLKEFLET